MHEYNQFFILFNLPFSRGFIGDFIMSFIRGLLEALMGFLLWVLERVYYDRVGILWYYGYY
jgi:hypothetical protein